MIRASRRVLVVHSYYRERGGEDKVFESESLAMESAGWQVIRLAGRNEDMVSKNLLQKSRDTIWNEQWKCKVASALREFRPDIVHFHNTFPAISPSAIWACKDAGVPVVQTLHNYRLGCLNGFFFREGKNCVECLGKAPLPGVRHGCYRSTSASAVLAASTVYHRRIGTYAGQVDHFISLSQFAKSQFISMGFNANRISVKPNALYPSPDFQPKAGSYCLYIGRLSKEKGIQTLVNTWRSNPSLPTLVIAGDGPLRPLLEANSDLPNLNFLGLQTASAIGEMVENARCLILPSEWNEVCPMSMVEALGAGVPIILSSLESLAEFSADTPAMVTFQTANEEALASTVAANFGPLGQQRQSARALFDRHFSSHASIAKLNQIYSELGSILGPSSEAALVG